MSRRDDYNCSIKLSNWIWIQVVRSNEFLLYPIKINQRTGAEQKCLWERERETLHSASWHNKCHPTPLQPTSQRAFIWACTWVLKHCLAKRVRAPEQEGWVPSQNSPSTIVRQTRRPFSGCSTTPGTDAHWELTDFYHKKKKIILLCNYTTELSPSKVVVVLSRYLVVAKHSPDPFFLVFSTRKISSFFMTGRMFVCFVPSLENKRLQPPFCRCQKTFQHAHRIADANQRIKGTLQSRQRGVSCQPPNLQTMICLPPWHGAKTKWRRTTRNHNMAALSGDGGLELLEVKGGKMLYPEKQRNKQG